MQVRIEVPPSSRTRVFHSSLPLSAHHQSWAFGVPLPARYEECYFRKAELIGPTGERLVQVLCSEPGVSDVILHPDSVTVILRENTNLAWDQVQPYVTAAFHLAFPNESIELLTG